MRVPRGFYEDSMRVPAARGCVLERKTAVPTLQSYLHEQKVHPCLTTYLPGRSIALSCVHHVTFGAGAGMDTLMVMGYRGRVHDISFCTQQCVCSSGVATHSAVYQRIPPSLRDAREEGVESDLVWLTRVWWFTSALSSSKNCTTCHQRSGRTSSP